MKKNLTSTYEPQRVLENPSIEEMLIEFARMTLRIL